MIMQTIMIVIIHMIIQVMIATYPFSRCRVMSGGPAGLSSFLVVLVMFGSSSSSSSGSGSGSGRGSGSGSGIINFQFH